MLRDMGFHRPAASRMHIAPGTYAYGYETNAVQTAGLL